MPDPFVLVEAGLLEAATAGDRLTLEADADHHLRRVLRAEAGDPLEVADGAGRTAPARLTSEGVELTARPALHPPRATAIEVVHALPKGRKLDEVVRVLTELEVARVVPVQAARSVVRLDEARRRKAGDRWRAIARSAAEQSRRPYLPAVEDPCDFEDAALPAGDPLLLVANLGAPTGLATALGAATTDGAVDRVVVAIGPEGGWTDDEVAALVARGGRRVHLGDTVLRTEHAATVAVAVIAAAVGRMA